MVNLWDIAQDDVTFSRAFLHVQGKDARLTRLVLTPTQRMLLKSLTGRDLILKARQIGASTAIQARIFRLLVTRSTLAVSLAHADEATDTLRQRQRRFLRYWPANIEGAPAPTVTTNNRTVLRYPEFNSEHYIAKAGSPDAIRSKAVTYAHLTEFAFYTKDILTPLSPMLRGPLVIESTPNGAAGPFYEMCMTALTDPDYPYTLHFYPWWTEPSYSLPVSFSLDLTPAEEDLVGKQGLSQGQILWRRMKMKELGRAFQQEFPEDPVTCFLLSGASYFGSIDHTYRSPGQIEPSTDHQYVAGIDWGTKQDRTVIVVFDATTRNMVDLQYWRGMEYPTIRREIIDVLDFWGVEYVMSEVNGVGLPNTQDLKRDIWRARSEGRLTGIIRIKEWDTTNLSKLAAASDLYEALHSRHSGRPFVTLLDRPELRAEMRAFTQTTTPSGKERLGASGDSHDDMVIATMLAVQAVLKMMSNKHEFRAREAL